MKDYLVIRYKGDYYGFTNNIVNKLNTETIEPILHLYLKTFMIERWLIKDYDIYIPILKANTISLVSTKVYKLIEKLPKIYYNITEKDLIPIKQNIKI
jgi:hypothetical protein